MKMKLWKSKLLIGLSLLVLTPAIGYAAEGGGKMTIAIVEFRNTSNYDGPWALGQGMSDMLATSLFKTGKFRIVERERLEKIMEEKQLARNGEVNSKDLAALGKLIGADYIITGNVTQFGLSQGGIGGEGGGFGRRGGGGFGGLGIKTQTAQVAVDVRIVDAKTGELIASDEGQGKESTGSVTAGGGNWRDFGGISFGSEGFDSSLPGKATRKAINDLVDKITGYLYPAKIIDVTGKEVTISLGSSGGITKDMKMNVISKGKELRDPDTGAILGYKESVVGQIRITDVQEKYSTGIILDGDGVIAPGNLVKKAN